MAAAKRIVAKMFTSGYYTKMVENWEWTEATYVMGDGDVTLLLSGERVE